MLFNKGETYKHMELHELYEGNHQSGISYPAKYSFIMLFTGGKGKIEGFYPDREENGIFYYSGEGKSGDMEFTRGNLQIRDHIKNGKELHMFRFVKKGYWKYIGQFESIEYEIQKAPGEDGIERKAIIFKLKEI